MTPNGMISDIEKEERVIKQMGQPGGMERVLGKMAVTVDKIGVAVVANAKADKTHAALPYDEAHPLPKNKEGQVTLPEGFLKWILILVAVCAVGGAMVFGAGGA